MYLSHDYCVFSLATLLGNMYNVCEFHSSSLHHSHSDCTLILSIVYKYMNMDMKHRGVVLLTKQAAFPQPLCVCDIPWVFTHTK